MLLPDSMGEYLEQVASCPAVYLVRIPSPQVVSGATNCFVLEDGGEWLVVDVGTRTPDGVRIWNRVRKELGIRRERTQLFLTHLHLDHAGMIEYLDLGDTRVMLPKANWDDYRFRFKPTNFAAMRERWWREGFGSLEMQCMEFFGPAYYAVPPLGDNIRYVNTGDVLRVGSLLLEVIDTSGHAPGHASLYLRSSGVLFDGDHVLFDITPVVEPCGYRLDILGEYLDKLSMVRDLEVSCHCHSHGGLRPAGAHAKRAAELIAHERHRAERAYAEIEGHPGMTGLEVISGRGGSTSGRAWDAVDMDLRNCILNNGTSILDHLLARGRIARKLDAQGRHRYYPR